MASLIDTSRDETLLALDAVMEAKAKPRRPNALGASEAGSACARESWYLFRWAFQPFFEAKVIRRLKGGYGAEDRMSERLKKLDDLDLHTVDHRTGKQFRFEMFGGHFVAYIDGAVQGLIQDPTNWYVWEHKETAEKGFNKLKKLIIEHGEWMALKHWNTKYYVQAQMNMQLAGIKNHWMTVSTPGGREDLAIRTAMDPADLERYTTRSAGIITASTPPTMINTRPDHWQCNMCNMRPVCKGEALPDVSCRTCKHSSPEIDGPAAGTWVCSKHSKTLSRDDQLAGCDDHAFIPETTSTVLDFVEEDPSGDTVTYAIRETGEMITNGPGAILSSELVAAAKTKSLSLALDPNVVAIKESFEGKIVEY